MLSVLHKVSEGIVIEILRQICAREPSMLTLGQDK